MELLKKVHQLLQRFLTMDGESAMSNIYQTFFTAIYNTARAVFLEKKVPLSYTSIKEVFFKIIPGEFFEATIMDYVRRKSNPWKEKERKIKKHHNMHKHKAHAQHYNHRHVVPHMFMPKIGHHVRHTPLDYRHHSIFD